VSDQLLTQSAWWTGNALEAILLYRALRGKFVGQYSVFYVYLSYVLVEQLIGFCVYVFAPSFYARFYWSMQFVSITIGYCVIWEIFRQVFGPYPGAGKVTRNLLAAILVLVLCKVFLNAPYHWQLAALSRNADELERYLRVVQASLLVVIIGLVAYYAIPLGKNVKGLILGYGIFIGLTVMQLAMGSYLGRSFRPVWKHLAWVSYSAALITWCATLWSYHPNPLPTADGGPERDYEILSTRTARLLGQIRSSVVRTIRP
jgi:hypothetical protein